MSNYTTIETEDPEHGDRAGVDDTRAELRWCDQCSKFVPVCDHDQPVTAKDQVKTILATVICSCGSKTCGMIGAFGHPEPIYKEAILPLPGQTAKDAKALELKGLQARKEKEIKDRQAGAFEWGN
jgi:hypothetical protein